MRTRVRRWLEDIPIHDPIERRQAPLVQIMLLLLLGAAFLGVPLSFIGASTSVFIRSLAPILLIALSAIAGLIVLRRGRMRVAILLAMIGSILALLILFLTDGLNKSADVIMLLLIPVTMAALMGGRRGLLIVVGLEILAVLAPVVLAAIVPELVSNPLPRHDQSFFLIGMFILTATVIALTLDRFGVALREALQASLTREHELEQLRDSLEEMVSERTAELKDALNISAEREARLAEALAEVEQQRSAIREMSVPVIPVSISTAVVPLIGALDSARLRELQTQALQSVTQLKTRYLVLDITGVPLIDTQVAQGIVRLVQAARLLGTEVLLVGVRPEVAQAIVGLGLNLPVRTFSNLQEALLRINGMMLETSWQN